VVGAHDHVVNPRRGAQGLIEPFGPFSIPADFRDAKTRPPGQDVNHLHHGSLRLLT
jgi:hypothetical protein